MMKTNQKSKYILWGYGEEYLHLNDARKVCAGHQSYLSRLADGEIPAGGSNRNRKASNNVNHRHDCQNEKCGIGHHRQ